MAGATTQHDVIAEDIEKLKSVARCKIIKNVGEFKFLVDAAIPDSDVLVKFQVAAEYPKVAPGLFVRHQDMTKGEIQRMLSTIPESTTSLLQLFNFVQCYIAEHHPTTVQNTKQQSSPRSSPTNKQKNPQSADQTENCSKKPSMRTAADVIKRIQWDSSLLSESFIVGYVDRFLGIQEQPFTSFNWVNPAEADWMDLNIPEHRIEYFKYNDVMVWEKQSRTDNVFGSTGGLTIDQIVMQGDTATESTTNGDDRPNEAVSTSEAKVSKASNGRKKQSVDTKKAQGESAVKEQRDRPTYFIAIPVTDDVVSQTVRDIQSEYLTLSESDGEEFKMELYNLHVTLCAVGIYNEEELDTVNEVLYDLIMEGGFQEEFGLTKLGNFWGKVLYAGVEFNKHFISFVLRLREALSNKGIRIYDSASEFTPHLTIFNFSSAKAKPIYFPVEDFIAIKSDQSGDAMRNVVVPLQNLVLYSMKRDDNNRYIKHLTLDLH